MPKCKHKWVELELVCNIHKPTEEESKEDPFLICRYARLPAEVCAHCGALVVKLEKIMQKSDR